MSGKNYGPNVSGFLDPTGRNWEDVIFQAGKAVLDKELNLGQDIDVGQAEAVVRRDLPSGWISGDFLNNGPGNSTLFASSPGTNTLVLQNALVANVNGWLFKIQHTDTINTNTVTLAAAPVGPAAQRIDVVILEVWRLLISPAPSTVGKSATGRIWQHGNVRTDPANDASLNFTDDIFDATLAQESTKRVQLQYRLRVVTGVDIFSYPYGLDDPTVFANTVPPSAGVPDGSPTAYNYVNQSSNGDAGLWIAGDGNPTNTLGTVDGLMYAIPLCAIFRRNSTAFNAFTNLNGAGTVTPGPSDRPDGLFNDTFVSNDMADLRMAVSPSGWDYQEVLDKNLGYLLDNALRSEWQSTAPYGGGTQGHTLFFSNQVGISSANGGSPPYAGDATGGGPRVGQFDNVCRSFSGRAIFEIMTVAVPAPLGGWVNGSVVTIDPTSLAVYPYSSFNWASFAPTNVQFVDVPRAQWIGTPPGKKRYDALSRNLVGTFHVIHGNAAVATTFDQTGIVQSGDTMFFADNFSAPYTVLTVSASTITLTTPYAGTTNTTAVAQDQQRTPRLVSITGTGAEPITSLTLTCGTIVPLGLTNETLYVDILVAYPSGSGLATTPTASFGATQQSFMVNNPTLLPNAAPVWFDQTLLTPIPATTFSYYNPTTGPNPLASLDFTHREARLTYTTTPLPALNMEANSENVSSNNFVVPERVSSIVSVLRNGIAIVGTTSLDATGRVVTLTNAADYTSPGDTLTVTYQAIRPFPEHGEQVTIFFDYRAPQTARQAILGTSQQVTPRYIPKQIHVLTSGVASPDEGYPFPTAYVQTGGIYATDFAPGGIGEYELAGEAYISISDFSASTGLLALPVYVNYTPAPNQVTFLRAPTDLDSEGRTFFKQAQAGVYIPNAYGQDLSDPRPHKNFLAFLAELATDSQLGFAGQLVLVLLTRWAINDETDGVYFDTNLVTNTTAAAIFRLRNNMLNKI